jgi:hypothetical protein
MHVGALRLLRSELRGSRSARPFFGMRRIQVRARFIVTRSSATRLAETGLTRGFTGRLARGIHNELLTELNRSDAEILPYPFQRSL